MFRPSGIDRARNPVTIVLAGERPCAFAAGVNPSLSGPRRVATSDHPFESEAGQAPGNRSRGGSNDAAASWATLDRELGRWRARGKAASFWWRDDDATRPTAALDRLLDISRRNNVPVAIASVPKFLSADLPARLHECPTVAVLQHGFAHQNHATGKGEGAWELGLHRGAERVLGELEDGRRIMQAAFAGKFIPVVAAPWNRIDRRLFPGLRDLGFIGASAFGERAAPPRLAGFTEANAHLDLLSWKGTPRFRGVAAALRDILEHVGRRRLGLADAEEPTGILSHHLSLDEAAWRFLAELIGFLARHPGVSWRPAGEVFGPKPAPSGAEA